MQIRVDDEVVLIGALERILHISKAGGIHLFDTTGLFQGAKSSLEEEVLVRYAVGRGKVRADGKGFNLAAELFDVNGKSDGKLVLNWETLATSVEDLTQRPSSVKVPLD